MRVSLSLLVSGITLALGIVFQKEGLWLPISVMIASLVYGVTGTWATSQRVGSAAAFSMSLKLLFNIVGLYATIGQFVCLIWLVRWFLL